MTKKKLSKQININNMSIGELNKLFKGNEQVSTILNQLIEAIDTPEDATPTAMIGSVTKRKNVDGSTTLNNAQALCAQCNQKKGNKIVKH